MLQAPALRQDALVRLVPEGVEVEFDDAIYTLSGAHPETIYHALISMNGMLSSAAIGIRVGLPESIVAKLASTLGTHGVVNERRGVATVPIEQFCKFCRRGYATWKRRLFSHPLWTGLTSGTADRAVFVGWVIESWWFIENVMDRLPMAVAHTENRKTREIYMRHFSEEWDHFAFFTKALDALGIDGSQRSLAEPLPATRAVRDWMRRSARKDPLLYAACSGFLESTGRDRGVARTFFERVREHYDDAGGAAVTPMADHVTLDEEYAHGSLLEQIVEAECGEDAMLGGARAEAALADAYGFVETLEMWSSDILRHYSSSGALPLARPRSYRSR